MGPRPGQLGHVRLGGASSGRSRRSSANREWAIGSRGVVYAVNSRLNSTVGPGKLVFVSTAKLDALLGR
jgi:hypothetical protein